MRLAELQPRWWADEGRDGQGCVFLCPHCIKVWLCVAFANPLDSGAPWDIGSERARPWRRLWALLYGDLQDDTVPGRVVDKGVAIVPPGFHWARSGDTFETLTLSPSIDASRSGHWHGFITGGMAAA